MAKQLSFFENKQNVTEIVISKQGTKPLSKVQLNFNKLTKNISKLEKQIIEKEKCLINLLDFHSKNIVPILIKQAKDKIGTAFFLEEILLKNKFSKRTQSEIIDLIQSLLHDSFSSIEPSKKEQELYNRYSETTFDEEKKEQIEILKEDFEEMIKFEFGIDIDLDDFDIENEEEMARFMKELQEKFSHEKSSKSKDFFKGKKTKKQLEKEKLEKEKIEAQFKSLKSVYLSLAKVLHPDTDKENDPIQKMEKEELMKKVSVAYKEKDLSTLLKLELEWVHKTEENLSKISEDKLKIYCEILRDRETELYREKFALENHPKFTPIEEYTSLNEKQALSGIKNKKNEIEYFGKSFNDNISVLKKLKNKKQISEFISDFHSEFVFEDDDDFFFDDDFFWK